MPAKPGFSTLSHAASRCRPAQPVAKTEMQAAGRKTNGHGVLNNFQGDFSESLCLTCPDEGKVAGR